MIRAHVAPTRTHGGVSTSTARTIEIASTILTGATASVTSVRVAHLSLDDQLAAVVREISSRPGVHLVVRPCVDGAYLVIEATHTVTPQPEPRQRRGSWLRRLLGFEDEEHQ